MRHEIKPDKVRWLAVDRSTGCVLASSAEVTPLSYAEVDAVEELRKKFRDFARTVTLKRYILSKEEAPPVERDIDWDDIFPEHCPNHGAHFLPCTECAREERLARVTRRHA